ncbi:adenylate kinase [Parasedimentitalea huanghaiensis]|uniref:Adenylate kinase n=1 Tax=Parasedimentitalea huanghaiensis TaxID=2682100 RepID=A0A6L6WHZ9_9RHOB|nr:adenylate kinase [Zongyanglinia huanghaiensis]MVO15322.1 adenylate kinase [Zongyanglinia huanghaiensis]
MQRIFVLGASCSGTTILGAAIAQKMGMLHVDSDDHYWAPVEPPFSQKRSAKDRVLSMQETMGDGDWVLSGSCMGWGEDLTRKATFIVFVSTDEQLRMRRLVARESQRYGNRIEPGGDMYKIHQDFVAWAGQYEDPDFQGRSRARHERWLDQQTPPILRVDGALTVEELTEHVAGTVRSTLG